MKKRRRRRKNICKQEKHPSRVEDFVILIKFEIFDFSIKKNSNSNMENMNQFYCKTILSMTEKDDINIVDNMNRPSTLIRSMDRE